MEANGLQNGSQPRSKRLACRQCQRRKIKCNRDFPCMQCDQAGIPCHESYRKKRAKPRFNTKREDDLRNRVASLESLVHKLNGDEAPSLGSAEILPSAHKYLASPFWSSLAGEVNALKEALEDDDDESDLEPSDSASGSSPSNVVSDSNTDNTNFEFILCGPNNILVLPDALYEPDVLIASDLFELHLERVERTWKIFHTPSLRALTQQGQSYLGRDAGAPCNLALKAAIQFAAISQLTEQDCEEKYGQPRAGLVESFQRRTEMKLIQADPMNTNALATLQALVLYVAALRRNDVSRRSWMIFALIVRLARAFNLHRESADETFFLRELRRRLWHNIVVLDTFFALDRGSEALITIGSFSRPLPTNLNDHDFGESTLSVSPREAQVTDMTFALAMEELSACIHHINFLEDKPAGETWQHRLHLAEAQQKTIEERYLRYCDPAIDFHRLILRVSRVVTTTLTLRAVRPMQRDPSNTLPAIDSPFVFELAVNSLRQCTAIIADLVLAKWKQLAWVQWHPIAVVLAGLCSTKNLDPDKQAEAWYLVDQMMAYSAKFVADTKKGSLWMPIEKLYKEAAKHRKAVEASRGDLLPQTEPAAPESAAIPASVAAADPPTTDTSTSEGTHASLDFNMDDIASMLEPADEFLDWDALIADMDAASNENILWA